MVKRMNIILDSSLAAPNVTGLDNNTTTYKTTTMENTGYVNSGYSLDIADKVMDDKAYQGHGLTADDIMQQAQNSQPQVQKDFMIVMSNSVSEKDFAKMSEEGFEAGSTDIETYVSIVDQIKVTLAKAGVQIAGYTDDIDVATLEEITGSQVNANELLKQMQQADLPITQENLDAIGTAMAQLQELTGLSEDAVKYMIMNQKTPTIENLYKAQFSSASSLKQAKGYYSESGYYAKKAEDYNWETLKGQMEKTINQAGLDNSDESIEQAKWLVESGIELTPENLKALAELEKLSFPINIQEGVMYAVNALANGKSPLKALMTGEENMFCQAGKLVEDINNISDEAIHNVVENEEQINLKNLSAAQKEIDGMQREKNNENDTITEVSEKSLQEITVKRQLEEIRLMMTQEANLKLLKSGFNIDTAELSEVVEALKNMENAMKTALFKGENAQESQIMAQLYEDTIATAKELMGMPAALIGKAVTQVKAGNTVTLSHLQEEGVILQRQYKAAGETYEALMTAPRKDLGDRIQKAFQNVDDILTDMGLETSQENRRAVRILGYNNMKISVDNITTVKEADSLVCGVIRKMTPSATLGMIRNQVNPLEMNIDELDEYLNEQSKDVLQDSEKFSKYLQKLDRSGKISQDEREAYIGIYRMFRQIEKSDGAVIGSLVASGAQMSFKNVLSAIRTNADKNMDIRIDEEFGGLEKLIAKSVAIDTQIQSGFKNSSEQNDSEKEADSKMQNRAQEKYYARLSGQINEELANSATVEQIEKISVTENTTIEQFADEIGVNEAAELNDMQKSLQEINNQQLEEFQQSLKEAQAIEDMVIQSLIDYEQPVSIDNIQAATMLIMERGSLYKQIFNKSESKIIDDENQQEEETISQEEKLWTAANQAIDNLNDKKSAQFSYQELVEEAAKAVENMIYAKGTSTVDVKAARNLYKGLNLAGKLAKEENYEFPVMIKGEITSVNLKIYHNQSTTGKVAVTFETENFGKTAAEFDVTKERISGIIAFDDKNQQNDWYEIKTELEKELASDGRQVQISLANTKILDVNKFGQDRADTQQLSTAQLYKTAKAFMTALRGLSDKYQNGKAEGITA